MPTSSRIRCLLVAVMLTAAASLAAQVERIGGCNIDGASEQLKAAVEDKGYHITLDDGWSADFWFVKLLQTAPQDAPDALYPALANSQFVGVVRLPKGMSDYRGQPIPAGAYTLRYQRIPQDANHMGVSPNPDFLLAIPVASDADPQVKYLYRKLVALSSKATGSNHPAVLALDTAGAPAALVKDAKSVVFTVAIPAAGGMEKIGIVVKGEAAQ